MTAGLLIPGRTLSTAGELERIAGHLIDHAHAMDQVAADHRGDIVYFARVAGIAHGLRTAVALTLCVEPHQVDALYAARFGHLVREVQGRPAGNAAGRAGADACPDIPFPFEDL